MCALDNAPWKLHGLEDAGPINGCKYMVKVGLLSRPAALAARLEPEADLAAVADVVLAATRRAADASRAAALHGRVAFLAGCVGRLLQQLGTVRASSSVTAAVLVGHQPTCTACETTCRGRGAPPQTKFLTFV